jgi:hypothetical protein
MANISERVFYCTYDNSDDASAHNIEQVYDISEIQKCLMPMNIFSSIPV